MSEKNWLDWRAKGIGASDAAAVCGVSQYRSRYQVWLEKTGKGGKQPENEAMLWGKRLEPIIMQFYEERTGLKIAAEFVQKRCEHTNYRWMRATLDAVNSAGQLVEVKACGIGTARGLGESGDTDSLPTAWILQVQHQMAVTGFSEADIAVFHPSLELRIYPVRRDDDLIEAMIDSEAEFWECVQEVREPTPETIEDYLDWTKRTASRGSRIALDNLEASNAATRLQAIRMSAKAIEQAESEAKYAIIRHLAGHEYGDLSDGRIIRAQTVEIAERTQVVKSHTQLRISIKEPKS